jgi:hypothetical protein
MPVGTFVRGRSKQGSTAVQLEFKRKDERRLIVRRAALPFAVARITVLLSSSECDERDCGLRPMFFNVHAAAA